MNPRTGSSETKRGGDRTLLRRALALAGLAALAFVVVLSYRLWSTRPQLSGRVSAVGLAGEVEVLRDDHGVPHIYARSDHDAYFALGYVHAQDRVFQVELQQRMASGTLSELIGEEALVSDRLFRALGLREVARASLPLLDAATRDALTGYVAGYNAALQAGAGAPELVLLRSTPTPLDAIGALVAFKLIAWQLSGNMLRELENYRLSQKFSFEQMSQLAPAAPGDVEHAWPSHDVASGGFAAPWLDDVARRMLGAAPSPGDSASGSNAWVVTAEHSRTGKPLLANDPHLGLSAPAVWYLAHLHAPGLNVIGATLPGTPGVWLGRNDHVAWGITNTGSDTQDLFVERLEPDDANRVQAPGGSEAMALRAERIRVRGAETQTFIARTTRHGPVVSDADPEVQQQLEADKAGHVLALAWTGLSAEDRSAQFAIKAARAGSASQLLAAAEDLRSPQQNLLYADDAGAVGLKAIGRLPKRGASNLVLGRLPVPGWDAAYDWQGEVPFAELPAQSPTSGRVLNANDRISSPDYPHWITSEWELPHRAERIAELLDEQPLHDVADFVRMQQDVRNPVARRLLPVLLDQLGNARTPEHAALIARLRAWDGTMSRGAPEALVFQAWVERLAERLYPPAYFEIRPVADPRVLLALVRGEGDSAQLCGPERQADCARQVRETFAETLETLRGRYGSEVDGWRWGSHNIAWFGHALFGGIPALGALFDLQLEREGSAETINLSGTAYDADSGEYVTAIGPSLRAIYDLAQPERSLFVVAPGQSGNPLSSHYRDLAQRWQRGEYVPMITARAALQRKPHDTLILSPRGGNER
jgi:penicillin amidase